MITIDDKKALKYINEFIEWHDKDLYEAGIIKTLEDNTIPLYLWETAMKKAEVNSNSVFDDIKTEIKEWYWQADKQALAKDPCVVDAMVDLFIRTIDKHIWERSKDDEWKESEPLDDVVELMKGVSE